MLKSVVASIAFALLLSLVASAATIETTFKSSTTGNSTIDVGDTITFEVTVLVPAGTPVDIGWFSLAGDISGAENSSAASGWSGVQNIVSNWDWHYTNGGKVKFGTNGWMYPIYTSDPAGPSRRQAHTYGFNSSSTGDGIPSLVGTVTITADTPGNFFAGGYLHPFVDVWSGSGVDIGADYLGASFTVAGDPEIAPPSDQYLIWPKSARLGETIAVLFNAELQAVLHSDNIALDASDTTISLKLTDSLGWTESISPAVVFEAPAALGSLIVGPDIESWTSIVAIFHLPAVWQSPNSNFVLPDEMSVTLEFRDTPTYAGKQLSVFDDEGTAITGEEIVSIRNLAPQPMLRLQAAWDPAGAGEGFDPAWDVGGLEFILRYTSTGTESVSNVTAILSGEAQSGQALVTDLGPDGADHLWKIAAIAPNGFTMPGTDCSVESGSCAPGRWSLIDLPMQKTKGSLSVGDAIFLPANFQIEDVRVFDRLGDQLSPAYYVGETYFELFAVNNLVDPAPSGASGSGDYLVWPTTARLGDTIGILFNSEQDEVNDPGSALLDANVDSISVVVMDSEGLTATLTPRAVIEAPAAMGSLLVGTQRLSQTGVLAVFDLPDDWSSVNPGLTFPDTFGITVDYNGQMTMGGNVVSVLGPGGSSLEFSSLGPLEDFQHNPMLRLRPAWDPGQAVGIDPAWTVGSIEFDLRFTKPMDGDVANPVALPNGDFRAALATTSNVELQGDDKLWKVSLISPDGVTVPSNCVGNDCASGRWSLLDVAFEKLEQGLVVGAEVFGVGDFSIENLKVADRDGAPLIQSASGAAFFDMFATNNLVLSAPDADSDGIEDDLDNCTLIANPDQRDDDEDGYGNICDTDVTQDCLTGGPDLAAVFEKTLTCAPWSPKSEGAYDVNEDGCVGGPDLGMVFANSLHPPGPSGRSCADCSAVPGTGVCP